MLSFEPQKCIVYLLKVIFDVDLQIAFVKSAAVFLRYGITSQNTAILLHKMVIVCIHSSAAVDVSGPRLTLQNEIIGLQ